MFNTCIKEPQEIVVALIKSRWVGLLPVLPFSGSIFRFPFFDFYLWGLGEVSPETFGICNANFIFVYVKAVSENVILPRLYCPVTQLRWSETEEHLSFGPDSHRFGMPEIFRVAHYRNTGPALADAPGHIAPPGTGSVAIRACPALAG